MADYKHTVILIDSLDVLSLSKDHSVMSFFLAQIDRLITIPNTTVIAACREFDRKYDRRLSERTWDKVVSCQPLDWENVVAPLISSWGINSSLLDATTQSLVQNPRELAMFADIAKQTGGFNIGTSQALSHKYLEIIIQDNSALGEPALIAVERIATEMLQARRLYIHRVRTSISDEVLKQLISTGVLLQNKSGNIEFGHQTLLDVLVIRDAERKKSSLKEFIEALPPVPFVRPTVRAYINYLAAGDRKLFRRQLRAAFDGQIAFHLKRLIAETLAEYVPCDDDWSLMKHLHTHHLGIFNALYIKADAIEWHHFWLKFFVPYIVREQNSQALASHTQRIASWKNIDPKGTLSFWSSALGYSWCDHNKIVHNLIFELTSFNSSTELSAAALIKELLKLPRREHDFLGKAIGHCISTGGSDDDLLWSYITGNIDEADVLSYNFNSKLRCQPDEFGKSEFLFQHMLKSENLLDLAVSDILKWSSVKHNKYYDDQNWHEGFLEETSYRINHSQRDHDHISAENVLFQILEDTIINHAQQDSTWWDNNRYNLSQSHEGAFRYFAIKAFTNWPEQNIDLIANVLLDKTMFESALHFEMGNLLNKAFIHLDSNSQDEILIIIPQLWADRENVDNLAWIQKARVELLSSIPVYLRSTETQEIVISWEHVFGPCIRQPNITQWGSFGIPAPFPYQWFIEASDSAVLKMLSHYHNEDENRTRWDDRLAVGGTREVGLQLREAASRSPTRFMHMLESYWQYIPPIFTEHFLEGTANHLSYLYGNLSKPQNWVEIEKPKPEYLMELLLNEIDRHPAHWRQSRTITNTIDACAHVVNSTAHASRLLFHTASFANLAETEKYLSSPPKSSVDLLTEGINISLGKIAEACMIIATNFSKKNITFPELLIPTIKQLSKNDNHAIKALILRRLPYLQYHLPVLGWEIFHSVIDYKNDFLWELAEPCLYYAYRERFDEISRILDRIASTSEGKALETWGRISALAVLDKKLDQKIFIEKLKTINNVFAWDGATAVWSNINNLKDHSALCFSGILVGLLEENTISFNVAQKASKLFHNKESRIMVPLNIVSLYFDTLEKNNTNNQFGLYDFDKWLNAQSEHYPAEALSLAERFIDFVQRTNFHLYSSDRSFPQLLTRLFHEAEEL